jgi:hypothetical protein
MLGDIFLHSKLLNLPESKIALMGATSEFEEDT